MRNPFIVNARVELFDADHGGRRGPVANGYSPHVIAGGAQGYARLLLAESEWIQLGAVSTVTLRLVGSDDFAREIKPEAVFAIFEGTREAGRGVVISVGLD